MVAPNAAYAFARNGDDFPRVIMDDNGTLYWGDGTYDLTTADNGIQLGRGDGMALIDYTPDGEGVALGSENGAILLETDGGTFSLLANGALGLPSGAQVYTYPSSSSLSSVGDAGDFAYITSPPGFYTCLGPSVWVPYPFNIGSVGVAVINTAEDSTITDLCAAVVTPRTFGEGPPSGYVSQYPDSAESMSPLNSVLSSDLGISVVTGPNLQPNLYDTVNVTGTLTVWDAAGANILVATFALPDGGLDDTSESATMVLTLVQVIGSDLSIADGASVVSAAGGSYNVLVQPYATWS